MTRQRLIQLASEHLGVSVKPHHLTYAIQIGVVKETRRWTDGWRNFDEDSLSELCEYMQNRSRAAGLRETGSAE